MAKQEKTAAELYREERKARLAKAAKKNAKKQNRIILTKTHKAVIAVIVVIAIVAGIGAFALNNSGVFERNKVAFNVGEIEVTAPEYGYYYSTVFNNYYSYSQQYDSYYGQGMGVTFTGYDWSVSPDQQAYTGELEGVENPMFTDFFEHSAKESIQYVKAHVLYAEEKEITLDEEELKSVEDTVAKVEESAESNNYSLPAYLRAMYGKGMTVELFEKICQEQTLATKVQEIKMDEYRETYDDKKVEETYKNDLETYGYVTLRTYAINADTVTEGEDEEATESVTDETMAEAKTKAETFVSKLTDEKSFKTLAGEYEKLAGNEEYKTFATDDSKTLTENINYSSLSSSSGSDEKFMEWAFGEDTDEGETYIVETEDKGYTVYMMVEPVHKAADSFTYDVRHILLRFPEEEETEETDEAEEETEEVEIELLKAEDYEDITVDIDVDLDETGDKALYKQAQDILKGYLDGDRTEDAFAELAVKHSADSNAADGGIYEDVTEGYMVSEFEDWALEKGRVKGDVGIVETQYGYHIMYFIGTETTTWADTIKTDLATVEYNEFAEEAIAADNVKISAEVEASIAKVEESLVSSAKQRIRNDSQSSSQQIVY